MNSVITQLVTAALGSVGFGLIFHVRARFLPHIAVGAFLGWLIYLICVGNGESIFLSTLIASFAVEVLAEILARVLKAPSTSFFLPSVIPLIPGRTLYYTILELVGSQSGEAMKYGTQTLIYAFGIAAGMSIAWACCDFSRRVRRHWGINDWR